MRTSVLFLVMGFILGACNLKKEEGVRIVKVYEESPTEKIDDFIASVEVVPLQTTDSCLISQVFNLHKGVDGSWYILAAGGTTIKHFGSDGRYLNSMGKQGQGPGEYRELSKFMISGDTIHFFDWNARKWIERLKDNTFVGEKRLPISLEAICRVKDKYFVYSEMGANETEKEVVEDEEQEKLGEKKNENYEILKHYLFFVDKDFKVLKMFDPKDPKRKAKILFGRDNFYAIEGGNYLYQRDYNDTIYEIDASALEARAKYVPDYGAITPPESYLAKIFSENMIAAYQVLMTSVKYPRDIKMAASPEYLLYGYYRGGEVNANYLTIYDRKKEASHIFSSGKTRYLNLFTNVFGYDGSSFYGFVSAQEYLAVVAELPDTPLYKGLKEKAKTLKEDDNPVLVLFKLKG